VLRYEIVEGDIMNDKKVIDSFYENGVFQDFYKLLEVNSSATEEEIKKSYRRLSKIYHPDFKTGNEEKMKQLGTAYRILKNEETKRLYDSYYLNQGKNKNVNQSESFHEYREPKSTFSNNYSSSYFSWNYIRCLLRKCHYSDSKIEGFITWCQANGIFISNGSSLSSKLREYNSLNYEENQIKKTNDIKSQEEKYRVFQNLGYQEAIESIFYRQMMVRQMIVSSMIRRYFENPITSFSPVSNLQIYGIYPVRVTIYPYVPTSRFVFYSRPKVKYYF